MALSSPSPNSLLHLDQTIRREADGILEDKGIRSILERYGKIHLTGSYRLELMAWHDLDILVEAPDITIEEFFRLGSEIAGVLSPTKMHFRNERLAKTPGLPVGLYWGVYLGDERDGAWKLDVWAVSPEHCEDTETYCRDILEKLTPESRLNILGVGTVP